MKNTRFGDVRNASGWFYSYFSKKYGLKSRELQHILPALQELEHQVSVLECRVQDVEGISE